MLIRHKGIYKDRMDAPFIGTLISAISCPFSCPGCINDPLKISDYNTIDIDEFINSVVEDKFNSGIILAGLEWTLQPVELSALVEKALINKLEIILYTYYDSKESLIKSSPYLKEFEGKGIYVKYGRYDDTKLVQGNVWYGVPLVSSNQYIELL